MDPEAGEKLRITRMDFMHSLENDVKPVRYGVTVITVITKYVASTIPARSHTLVEIDHELISTVILLSSAESFKKGCCQSKAKVCAQSTG